MLGEPAHSDTGAKSLTTSNGNLPAKRLGSTENGSATTSSVWPSGAALATISLPMMVLPPGRLSTTTGCPHVFWNSCASVRPSTSLKPLGGNGHDDSDGLGRKTLSSRGQRKCQHRDSNDDALQQSAHAA